MKELDVRGLSCPEPVMQLQRALRENPNEPLLVLASEAHTVKNLVNFAEGKGKSAIVKEIGLEYEITVR